MTKILCKGRSSYSIVVGMLASLIFFEIATTSWLGSALAYADTKPTREEVLAAARETAVAARFAALITLDANGNMKARTVDPFAPEDDFTVWLATSWVTRKVGEIKRNNKVSLYYFDPKTLAYLILLGTAELVEPSKLSREYWKPEWKAYYSKGPASEEYLLIKVSPHTLEYYHEARKIWTNPWKPYVLKLAGAKAER